MRQEWGRREATVRAYKKHYRYFWLYLRAHGVKAEKERITKEHIVGWVASMRTAGLSGATIKNRLGALSAFFDWLHRENLIKVNPCRAVPRPRSDPWQPRGALTQAQAEGVLRQAGRTPQGQALLCLMWQAGGRSGETIGTDWPDIEWARRAWWIANGKGGRRRLVPLSALTLEHLGRLWELRGRPERGPIFLVRASRRRLPYGALWKQVKGWCRRAGVPRASPHWFRHTYLTRLAECASSPADIRRIQKLAGHARVETTICYIHTPEMDRGLVDQAFGIGT